MKPRRKRPDDPAYARLTIAVVALEFGHPDLCLRMDRRGTRDLIFARQIAMYVLQTVFDMTSARVGELFSRDRSTVVHAINVVEDSRDDTVLNRKLTKVEDFLLESCALFGGGA